MGRRKRERGRERRNGKEEGRDAVGRRKRDAVGRRKRDAVGRRKRDAGQTGLAR